MIKNYYKVIYFIKSDKQYKFRWFRNNKRHREDGPACVNKALGEHWYYNGYLHRDTHPAVEYIDGGKEWWTHGHMISEEYISNGRLLHIKHI